MDKNEIKKVKKDEIKRGLEHCSAIDFETGCSDCPYRYRCVALFKDALNLITEQEKEIEQLTRERNRQAEELAKEQEACVECELDHVWKLYDRNIEIDRLRAEKKNVVKEFAKKLKARITKFIGRHDLSVRFFNDIMSDLLKEYEK